MSPLTVKWTTMQQFKVLFVSILLFAGFKSFSQVPFELGSIRVDSVYMKQQGVWVKYVYDARFVISDSLSLVRNDINGLRDSIDDHRVVLTAYDGRLDAMELIDHTHSNKAILDASTASFTTTLSSAISTATSTNSTQDSRLAIMEAIDHTHSNKTTLDLVTSAYKDADSTNLASLLSRMTTAESNITAIKDSAEVQLVIDVDTLPSVEVNTGNIFVIGRRLDGYILTEATIYTAEAGDGTASATIYRLRGASQATMTSSAATVTASTRTNATINASYDDVQEGDWIQIGCSDTGTPTSTGLNAVLIFKKP